MKNQTLLLCALAFGGSAGCSAGSAGAGLASGPHDNGTGGSNSTGAGGSGGGGGAFAPTFDAASGPVTPEQEQNLAFLAPRAGANYVYVANPSRNTVTAIRSDTLEISDQATGDSPTYLATVPGQDIALVINAGSHTLSILSGNQVSQTSIPVVAKANTIAIAPDGRHAVIWFDATQAPVTKTTAPTTGSTQEVSVVALTPATTIAAAAATVVSMSVGYNPSAVVFSNDNAAAFVVTDDGISELRFANITAPGIAPFTPIGTGPTAFVRPDGGTTGSDVGASPADAAPSGGPTGTGGSKGGLALDGGASIDGGEHADTAVFPPDAAPSPTAPTGKPVDVSVTPDGAFAIARRESSSQVLLVDLKKQSVTSLDLSSTITDLDLLPDGSQAFAVLREESKLVRIDVPAGFTDGAHRTDWPFGGTTIGSVTMSGNGRYALLYTTAADATVKSLVIFDLVQNLYRTVELHKTIRAVAVAPNEQTALVLHRAPGPSGAGGSSGAAGSSGSTDSGYGYTLVHLNDGFTKLQQTAADPNPFAITPNSTYAFVLLRDDKAGVRIAERVSLTSFLADDFQLGSPPSSISALGTDAHKVFVGQVYAEGRISFIDWLTGSVQTVTGFALNGRIQQ